MKKIFLIFVLFLVVSAMLAAEKMVISVPYSSTEQVQNYIDNGYDIAKVFKETNEIHLVVNNDQMLEFQNRYSNVRIVFTESEMLENLQSSNRDIPGYQTYTQIVQRLFELETLYPNYAKVIPLGPTQGKLYFDSGKNHYSIYNHIMYALKLSNDVEIYQDKPNYYFMGAIHAREPLAAQVVMAIIENMLSTYSSTDTQHPMNDTQVWFIPVVNPDGHHVVLSQMDIWHRKTIFDNNNNGVFDYIPNTSGNNVDGIDGNRNFDFYWGTTGISFNFATQTYPGTHPFSAVETSYIRDLAAEIPFIAGFSYHTYGNLVLWPYGYAYGGDSTNRDAATNLAIEVANLMPRYNSTQKYNPTSSWELYPASGSSEDYLHYYHNILAYTVELADQFIPNAAAVTFHTQNQLPAAYHLMTRHRNRFLTGLVTDVSTQLPVKAEILVYPLDSHYPEKEPVFSDIRYGRYNYVLMPGEYKLLVRADGYYPFKTDFTIFATEQTIIDIELTPTDMFTQCLVLNHENEQILFNGLAAIVKHNRVDLLRVSATGTLNVQNVSPGDMLIILQGNDLRKYITTVDAQDYIYSVTFSDFTYIDEFESLTGNWAGSNWTITTADKYSGTSSVMVSSYINNNALTKTTPIIIPPDEKTYVSFMAKYNSSMQSEIYIEFSISANNQTWTVLKQIRYTNGWENFHFVFNENEYQQLYFRFNVRRHASAQPGPFYLDLFSVKVGDANVTIVEPPEPVPNPVTLLTPTDLEIVSRNPDFTWELPKDGSEIEGLRFYITDTENEWESYFTLSGTDTTYNLPDLLEYETIYYWKVIPYNSTGEAENNDVFSFTTETDTDSKEHEKIKLNTELIGNYPNPFNPETVIRFSLASDDHVVLDIFNIRGQKIKTIANNHFSAGIHDVVWDGFDDNGRAVSSGLYLYVIQMGEYKNTKRMIMLK